MNVIKNLFVVILILFISILANKKANALNTFELSLLGIGVGFAAIQYFDTSLNTQNNYKQKTLIINQFLESKKKNIQSTYFRSLPIHHQLVLIEELNNF